MIAVALGGEDEPTKPIPTLLIDKEVIISWHKSEIISTEDLQKLIFGGDVLTDIGWIKIKYD